MVRNLARMLVVVAAAALPLAAHAKVVVVTSTTDLADVVRAVGGDRVTVSSITSGTQDAHFIDAKPSYMVLARGADLFVESGMELDAAWVGAIIEGSRNARLAPGKPGRLDASANVRRLEVPGGTIDRSLGDVHAQGNPHWWLDPLNVRIVAGDVAARLAAIDPPSAAAYEQGAAAFRKRLDEATFGKELVAAAGGDRAWTLAADPSFPANLAGLPPLGGWMGKLAPHRGARVFTHHRSWTYLLNRFGLISAGEIEPKPGIPPTPGHLVELVNAATQQPVRAILVEPYYSSQAGQLVASRVGAKLLRLPISSGGDAQAGDWFALMDHVVGELAGALGGA
jgi:zinc/manganese transport system substrate-binding protein